MNYRCQPINPDSWCNKCQRYTTEQHVNVFVTCGSTDEDCGYLPIDGKQKTVSLVPLVFKSYVEVK